jgi:hypothetical protein
MAQDHGQKIIEIVGNAAGKLSDRCHFVGLLRGRMFLFRHGSGAR